MRVPAILLLPLSWLASGQAAAQTAAGDQVEHIVIRGNTVLPNQTIEGFKKDFEGRTLDADGLEDIRRALTLAYVKAKFIASGAIMKPNALENRVLTIDVVEGYVVGIDVKVIEVDRHGQSQREVQQPWFARYVCDRLGLLPGGWLSGPKPDSSVRVISCGEPRSLNERPLNEDDVRHRVAELLQDPNIARLNIDILPGSVPGEARIEAKAVENPSSYSFVIANDQAPDVGTVHGQMGATLRGLLGLGDALTLGYGRTAGANLANARFEIPVTDYDTRIAPYWNYTEAGVVSAAFSGLGIRNRNQLAGISVIQPLLFTEDQALSATLSLDHTISDQWLLGEPFSFEPGYVNGHAEDSALRLSLDWTYRDRDVQLLSLHGSVSHGLDILGATSTHAAPNAGFTSVQGQAQYVARLVEGLQFVGRFAGQVSSQPLFSFEQIAVGGPATVRGFSQNALVSDEALVGSAELRASVGRLTIPDFSELDSDGEIDVGLFSDVGQGWSHRGYAPSPGRISSLGLGVRWEPRSGFAAQVYYGYGFDHPHNVPNLLQPISFAVGVQF